jgi:hypothetical protein
MFAPLGWRPGVEAEVTAARMPAAVRAVATEVAEEKEEEEQVKEEVTGG